MARRACLLALVMLASLTFAGRAHAAVQGCGPGGDFDGNGEQDLIAGVPHENVDGMEDAGALHVVYAGADGRLQLSDPPTLLLHQGLLDVDGDPQPFDLFGAAVAAGDFDGDGFDDLASGVPFDAASGARSGAVQVFRGSSSGVSTGGSFITPTLAGIPNDPDQRFGAALAAADFDGDGYEDLAIGAPAKDLDEQNGEGAFIVVPGSVTGLLPAATEQVTQADWGGPDGGSEIGDGFGAALATGRFKGGSACDLAVGAPAERVGSRWDAGIVSFAYGSPDGLQTSGALSQDSPGIAGTAEVGDGFGYSLAAGDTDADGDDDMLIGAPFEAIGSRAAAGVVHLLYGSTDGLLTAGDAWHADVPGIDGAAEAFDRFGLSLAVGDVVGDGAADLVAGIPYEALGSVTAGAVHIIRGLDSVGLIEDGDEAWHQGRSPETDGNQSGDRYGSAVAAGGGWMAVGVPGENLGSLIDVGALSIVDLRSSGDRWWHQNSASFSDDAQGYDRLGAPLG